MNTAFNITSTVAKNLMRKNLIQRRTRSFDLSISLLVTFSSFVFVVVVVPCFFYDITRVQFGVSFELVLFTFNKRKLYCS